MGKEIKNKTFIFNCEWQEVLMEYPAEVRLEVYDAIIEYAASGTLSELKPLAKMAFSFIKKEIDYNTQRYEETVEKRKEAGRKGSDSRWNCKQQKDVPKMANDSKDSKCHNNIANDSKDSYNDNDNDIKEKNIKKEFEIFRKQYPGTKRGLETEFSNFKKKHKDYKDAVKLLLPAIQKLEIWREKKRSAGQFVPEYANLSTWINQRRWEVELEEIVTNDKESTKKPVVID